MIMNKCNQVPYLTKGTLLESDKTQEKYHTQQSKFPYKDIGKQSKFPYKDIGKQSKFTSEAAISDQDPCCFAPYGVYFAAYSFFKSVF